MNNCLTACGLVLDIGGAILIAKGVFMRSPDELVDITYPDKYYPNSQSDKDRVMSFYNIKTLASNLTDQYLTTMGIIILTTGFSMQIAGVLLKVVVKINHLLFITAILVFASYLIANIINTKKREQTAEELYYRKANRTIRIPFSINPFSQNNQALADALELIAPHLTTYTSLNDHPEKLPASLRWLSDKINHMAKNDTLPSDVRKWENIK